MSDPDYAIESRKVVCDVVNKEKFNYIVTIFADTHEKLVKSWYYFGGHPYDWTTEDKNDIARQMCEQAAERFKTTDWNNPAASTIRTRKRIVFEKPYYTSNYVCLLCLQLWFFDHTKRHFFWVEWCLKKFGLSIGFASGLKSSDNKLYWSFDLLIGPLMFRLTGDE